MLNDYESPTIHGQTMQTVNFIPNNIRTRNGVM